MSQNQASLIWNIAELLRGSWKQHEYQDVILPLTVLKRLDETLKPSKEKVLSQFNQFDGKIDTSPILKATTGLGFYNSSPYDFEKLLESPGDIAQNLRNYLTGFSEDIQEVIEKFDFEKQISRMEGGNLLFLILQEFNKVDLSLDAVSNHEMGYVFEELIRKFSEQSNETAGEHYTPREVIHLMVDILFTPDEEELKRPHVVKSVYDPACGTGGMLTASKEHILSQINPDASIHLHGQELNPVTYAICKADMLIKGEEADNIKGGEKDHSKASTLSNDQFATEKFDYILANPPFGVDWKKDAEAVKNEAERGFAGRFGAGLPRSSDGQLLFLQTMVSKMRNASEGGSRIAVVFNGSPLFTGDAGSGESEIRRWILENDLLESIIALPDQLFYNTGINTYIWVLSNKKTEKKKGNVQLIDSRKFFKKMRKSLGNKRHEISDENRETIHDLFSKYEESEYSKIFKNTDFAFRQITIERPLRLKLSLNDADISQLKEELKIKNEEQKNEIIEILEKNISDETWINRENFLDFLSEIFTKADIKITPAIKKQIVKICGERDEDADICRDSKGNPEPDSDLRDTENVPYMQDVYKYFEKEVLPFIEDAWIDEKKIDAKDGQVGKVGYEFPVTRYFYKYEAPRNLEDIESDIETVENELLNMLKDLTK